MNLDSSRSHWLIVGISFLLTLGIYIQTGCHGYGFDDQLTTQLHPKVSKGLAGIPEILSSNYIEVNGRKADYRPVAQVTFAIEQSIFGSRPEISHLINILLYVFVIGLLGSILQKQNAKGISAVSSFAILLFAVHPIHTEVIASLKNREEILALLFGLLSWYGMIRYSLYRNLWWVIFAIAAFIIGVMSKISAAPLALIIPFSLWYFKSTSRKSILMVALAMLTSIGVYFAIVTQLLPWEDRVYQFIERPLAFTNNPSEQLLAIISSIGYYIKLAIWPYPMSIYYGYDAVPTSSALGVLLSACAIVGLLVLSIIGTVKRTLMGYGLAIFLIALIPVSNIFYPIAGTVVDRGLFNPSIGACIAIAAVICSLIQSRFKWIGIFILGALTVGYLTISTIRVNDWKSLENLLIVDISNHPKSAKLHQLLGNLYLDKAKASKYEKGTALALKAAHQFETSLSINDEWAWLNKQLGLTYAQFLRAPDKAIPYFRREFQIKPKNFTASFNLAKCFDSVGKNDSSLIYTKETLAINPDHLPSLRQIARSYLLSGDTLIGMRYLNKIIVSYPKSDDPYLILAEMNFQKRDTLRAIENLEMAIEVNPKNDNTLKFLFQYFHTKGEIEKAESYRDLASMN
jgi:Tfp pilus assembly protein PilF